MRKIFIICTVFILLFAVGCASTNSDAVNNYMSQLSDSSSEKDSEWTYRYYVDDFGNATSEAYMRLKDTYAEGLFSNSATNNSQMYAKFLVNRSDIDIELFEYDSMFPVTLLSFERAYIKVQTDNGETIDLGTCYAHYNGKRISIERNSALKLFQAMSTSKSIKFRIVVSSEYGSSDIYNFSVDTTGFVRTYQQAFPAIK